MKLLDVPVEHTDEPLDLADPIVSSLLPGGRVHLSAIRDRALLRVDGVGAFEVEGGTRIRFAPQRSAMPGPENRILRAAVASLLLAQRGQFALHASVAVVGGVTVALCGSRGAGKSTTVLRLEQRGHRVVTDDLTPLRIAGRDLIVEPLTEIVRVLPETAARLG